MVPKKILLCTDFSENSEPARLLAMDYAKAFGAQLIVVHAIDTTVFPSYVGWVTQEINDILARIEENAKESLQQVAEQCRLVVPDVKTYCTTGSASFEIVAVANEESADLIVIGTHGRTGVKHLVMGSIARSVLRTAHRPVLIVEATTD
jgi:universal stress protein A